MMCKASRDFLLRNGCEPLCGAALDKLEVLGDGARGGAFYPPTLLYCADPLTHQAVHGTEAFGPVATLMPYADTEQAIALALLGQGSLAGSLVTADPALAKRFIRAAACAHGRMLILDEQAAAGVHRPRFAVADAGARRPGARRRR